MTMASPINSLAFFLKSASSVWRLLNSAWRLLQLLVFVLVAKEGGEVEEAGGPLGLGDGRQQHGLINVD